MGRIAFAFYQSTLVPYYRRIACARRVDGCPAQSVFDNKDMAHAKRGMEIAQKSDLAYDLVASLTTEVGRRPAGSENDAKPVAWAIAKFNAMGFDRVWKDPIKVDAWKRIGAHADLVAPYHQHLALAALGNSISTAP